MRIKVVIKVVYGGQYYMQTEEFYRAKMSEIEKHRLKVQEELKRLREYAEKHKEARKKSNMKAKKLLQEIRELRKKRQRKVEEIKEIKEELKKVKERIRVLSEEIKNKSGKESAIREKRVRERIEELEWVIQTNPLPLEKENMLVKEIARLEGEVEIWEKLKKMREEIGELKKRRQRILDEIRQKSEGIALLDEKIFELQEKMMEFRAQAEQAHKNFLEVFGKIVEKENELVKLEDEEAVYRRLYNKALKKRKEEEERKKKKMMKERAAAIREKLKRGERISIQELKLVFLEEL
ncbi:MAG: hypothetical protein ACTSUS_08540 [Candidatus Freyarchaeota archaeon]